MYSLQNRNASSLQACSGLIPWAAAGMQIEARASKSPPAVDAARRLKPYRFIANPFAFLGTGSSGGASLPERPPAATGRTASETTTVAAMGCAAMGPKSRFSRAGTARAGRGSRSAGRARGARRLVGGLFRRRFLGGLGLLRRRFALRHGRAAGGAEIGPLLLEARHQSRRGGARAPELDVALALGRDRHHLGACRASS